MTSKTRNEVPALIPRLIGKYSITISISISEA